MIRTAPERPRLDPVVRAVHRLDDRPHGAARRPDRDGARRRRARRRSSCPVRVPRVARRSTSITACGATAPSSVFSCRRTAPSSAEQPDGRTRRPGRRRAAELYATCLRKAHAVVGKELAAGTLGGCDPLSAAEPQTVCCGGLLNRGRRSTQRPTRSFSSGSRPRRAKQPQRRADPAGEHEADAMPPAGDERQLRLQLRTDVGGFAELAAQLLDRARELLALRVQLAADLLRRAVREASALQRLGRELCLCDRLLGYRRRALLDRPAREQRRADRSARRAARSRSAARATSPATSRAPPRSSRTGTRGRRADEQRGATPSPMPIPSDATFFFSSSAASSTSSRAIAVACSATCFAAPPTRRSPARQYLGWACPLQSTSFASR